MPSSRPETHSRNEKWARSPSFFRNYEILACFASAHEASGRPRTRTAWPAWSARVLQRGHKSKKVLEFSPSIAILARFAKRVPQGPSPQHQPPPQIGSLHEADE